jgi:hypothetical protein
MLLQGGVQNRGRRHKKDHGGLSIDDSMVCRLTHRSLVNGDTVAVGARSITTSRLPTSAGGDPAIE